MSEFDDLMGGNPIDKLDKLLFSLRQSSINKLDTDELLDRILDKEEWDEDYLKQVKQRILTISQN